MRKAVNSDSCAVFLDGWGAFPTRCDLISHKKNEPLN